MGGREMYSNKELEKLISQQRKEMYSVALREGLHNSKTIESSKKLDTLLNQYQPYLKY
jgi:hypothetical protein